MKNVLIAIVAMFAMFAFATPALANGYTVCIGGNCAYTNITDAMNNAAEGNIITVNGQYTFNEYVMWSNDNITLDCNNSLINASSYPWNGIEINGYDNNLVRNCIIESNTGYSAIMISDAENNIIYNNELYTAVSGVNFYNANHNILMLNTIYDVTSGIQLNNASINDIMNNTIYDGNYGVEMETGSNNNTIYGNEIYDMAYGANLDGASLNHIFENEIYSSQFGLYVQNGANNNFIYNNDISDVNAGIYIYDTEYTAIFENNIYEFSNEGVWADRSEFVWIHDNNIHDTDTGAYGIYNTETSNMLIENNNITDLTGGSYGIYMSNPATPISNIFIENNNLSMIDQYAFWAGYGGFYDGNISGNTIYNATQGGIIGFAFNNTTISHNNIDGATGQYGIYIAVPTSYNIIEYNEITNSDVGIYVDLEDNTEIYNNIVHDVCSGIVLMEAEETYSMYNEIYNANSSLEFCGSRFDGIGYYVGSAFSGSSVYMYQDYIHDSEYGLYSDNSEVYAFNTEIYRTPNMTTVYSDDSMLMFVDSYINAAPPGPITLPIDTGYDFDLSDTFVGMINTTFNESSVYFQSGFDSEIIVFWNLIGYVQTKNEYPIEGADVTFTGLEVIDDIGITGISDRAIINSVIGDKGMTLNSITPEQPAQSPSLTKTTNSEGYTEPILTAAKDIFFNSTDDSVTTEEYNTTVDAVKGDYSDTVVLTPTESQIVTLTLPYNRATGAVGGGGGGYTPLGTTTNMGAFTGTNNQQMGKGDTLGFTWGGGDHSMKLTTLGNTFIWLLISSDPQNVKVTVGNTTEVDIDGDGVMDMSILLSKIEDGKAYLTFAPITPVEQPAQQPAGEQQQAEVTPTGAQPMSNTWLVAVVIVILVVAGLYLMKGKMKGKKK